MLDEGQGPEEVGIFATARINWKRIQNQIVAVHDIPKLCLHCFPGALLSDNPLGPVVLGGIIFPP